MATDLEDLIGALDFETGKKLVATDLTELIKAGVPVYNAMASTAFVLTGTLVDRDATDLEKRALVLCATLVYIDQKALEASENAVTVSNVAGKTSLDGIEFALSKRRRELLEQQLNPLIARISDSGVMGEVVAEELGETIETSETATSPVSR